MSRCERQAPCGAASAAGADTAAALQVPAPAAGPRVLLVDAYPNFREVLKFFLCAWFPGAQLIEAGNATEAARLLARQAPDLVITDLDFPDAPGVGILHTCRRLAPHTPVLVCTNHDAREREGQALSQGARAFLRKWQFESEAVRLLLEGLLGRVSVPGGPGGEGRCG